MTILGCFQFQVYISRSPDIQPATALRLFSLQKLGAETEHFENFEQRSVNWDTSWLYPESSWGTMTTEEVKTNKYMVETIIYNYNIIIIEKTLGNSLQCHQTWLWQFHIYFDDLRSMFDLHSGFSIAAIIRIMILGVSNQSRKKHGTSWQRHVFF